MVSSRQPTCKLRSLRKSTSVLAVVLLSLFCLIDIRLCHAIEAKWTPNEKDDGPLPLSQSQRNQLLKLEETITSSPNPENTLEQIASQNGMPAEELASMLQRNRRDLEMGLASPGEGGDATAVGKIIGGVISLMVTIWKFALLHPRRLSMYLGILFSMLYIIIMAPRTGVVLSSRSSILSRGHSTLFQPPQEYLDDYLLRTHREWDFRKDLKNVLSVMNKSQFREEILDMDVDGVSISKVGRKAEYPHSEDFSLFVTSRKKIPLESFLDEDDDEDDDLLTSKREEIASSLYSSASHVLTARRFTEYSHPSIKFHTNTSTKKISKTSLLIVKKIGDLNRYGIQPLLELNDQEERKQASLTDDDDDDDDDSEMEEFRVLTFGSWKDSGVWDGILRIEINKQVTGEDAGVVVSVSLIIPKKGRKISKRLATKLASSLSSSIATTVTSEAKKDIYRRFQSSAYKSRVHKLSTERRRFNALNVAKDEEMSRDRRRKWQRNNPDPGRYRPSGDRMRSPKNC